MEDVITLWRCKECDETFYTDYKQATPVSCPYCKSEQVEEV